MIRIINKTGMCRDTEAFFIDDKGNSHPLRYVSGVMLDPITVGGAFVSGSIRFNRIEVDMLAQLGAVLDTGRDPDPDDA